MLSVRTAGSQPDQSGSRAAGSNVPLIASAAAMSAPERARGVCARAMPGRSRARAHIEAHDGGRLLPEHLAASSLEELQAVMPPGLTFDPVTVVGSTPGALGGGGDIGIDHAPEGIGCIAILRSGSFL